MSETMRLGEVAKYLGVGATSVRNYTNSGKLPCFYTPGGQRIYRRADVERFAGVVEAEVRPVGYVRSSDGNKASLATQRKLVRETYPGVKIYTDRSSGLNENRKGLMAALAVIESGEANTLVLTNKDRLARFGTKYLEMLVESYGGKIEYLQDSKELSMQEELMQDFMALIASFSGRFYRLRGHEQQKKLLDRAGERLAEKENN